MPRHAGLTEDVTRRIEDFVVVLLLPMFFAYTGLKNQRRPADQPSRSPGYVIVAIVGKFVGAAIAARLTGSTGGVGRDRHPHEHARADRADRAQPRAREGVISDALFAALVLMALVTTFMAGPLLKLFDPNNSYGAPLEEEFEDARAMSMAEFPTSWCPTARSWWRCRTRQSSISYVRWRSSGALGAAARADPRAPAATDAGASARSADRNMRLREATTR